MARYNIPDEAWAVIQSSLPAEPATPRAGRPWAEHRMIINGMFWVLCSSVPWSDLPERYRPWKTLYNLFNRWPKSGVINIIFNTFISGCTWSPELVCHGAGWQQHPAFRCTADKPDITARTALLSSGFVTKIHLATDNRSKLNRDAYLNLNVVEKCFGRLKGYRRITTRYDKTARNYLAIA